MITLQSLLLAAGGGDRDDTDALLLRIALGF
jgi:hypothetical protein